VVDKLMALVTSQGGLNKAKVNEQRGQIIAGLQKAGLRKAINLGDIDFGSMAEKLCCLKRGGGRGMAYFEQLHAIIQNIYINKIVYLIFSFMLVACNSDNFI